MCSLICLLKGWTKSIFPFTICHSKPKSSKHNVQTLKVHDIVSSLLNIMSTFTVNLPLLFSFLPNTDWPTAGHR